MCPNINNENVRNQFNSIIKAFGGAPMTIEEFKNKELRNQRSGVDDSAMQIAYSVWAKTNGEPFIGSNIRQSVNDILGINNNEVNYTLKAADILLSDKAKQVFSEGEKNKWSLDKILTELAIPKEQKQLLLDLGIKDREQLALELVSKYSYSVEVNTAIGKKDYEWSPELVDINTLETTEDAVIERKGIPTSFYSNLTVPGGTNYTENEISTPLITPSIKGHAKFSTDKGIGWFRSDEQQNTTGKGNLIQDGFNDDGTPYMIEASDDYMPVKTKTRRILEIQSDLFQKGRDKDRIVNWQEMAYDKSFCSVHPNHLNLASSYSFLLSQSFQHS